jgi:hypothetical protein
VVWRSATILVPLWLVNTTRELRASRFRLAEQATLQERIRIDGDLRRTIQPALGAIVDRGDRAKSLVGGPDAPAELRQLANSSRAALADARQLIRSRLIGTSDPGLNAAASAELRAGIAAVLRAPGVSSCLITVSGVSNRVHITVDGSPLRASGRTATS